MILSIPEATLILEIGNVFYQIYSQGEPGENHFLKVDAIPGSRMEPYSRRMETNRMSERFLMMES